MNSLKNKVVHALLWSGLGQFARQGITLAIGLMLARLLSPVEFGLLAMVVILTGFAELILECGLGSALVQHSELKDEHTNSVFWLTILVGGISTSVFVMGAPLVARYFEQPMLEWITIALAINFPLVALRCVPYAMLARAMNFRAVAIAELIATLVSGSVAIGLAFAGFGVWALISQILLRNLLLTIAFWGQTRWSPRWMFSVTALREMLAYSVHVLGFQTADYWSMRIDHFLIGSFLGAAPLGLYTKGFEMMMLPVRQIGAMATRVMFPAFSKIQDDPARMKAIYLKSIGCIALVAFPVILGLGVAADSIIPTLLGPQWVETIPLIRILCLIGAVHAIGTTTSWIYMSTGRTGLMFKWGLFVGMMKTVAIVIGLRWGILGVAWASFVVQFAVLLYPNFAIPGKLIGLSVREIWMAVQAPMLMSLLMCGVVFGVGWALPSELAIWARCLIQVSMGGLFYWGLIHSLRVKPYQYLRGVITERSTGMFAKASPVV
ncbi:MAG: MOP flippase family protein [Planctomycetota bacterium]|nr:MOP flippase family protein [Planctomycetota bacterium]